MSKTVNDVIRDLQKLKPSLRALPMVIIAPNGSLLVPKAKILREQKETLLDNPKQIVITY